MADLSADEKAQELRTPENIILNADILQELVNQYLRKKLKNI